MRRGGGRGRQLVAPRGGRRRGPAGQRRRPRRVRLGARLGAHRRAARPLAAREGPARAAAFTWDAVADRAIEALARSRQPAGPLADPDGGPAAASPRRDRDADPAPRIAFFSPLPPNPSGVANYAEALIDALGGPLRDRPVPRRRRGPRSRGSGRAGSGASITGCSRGSTGPGRTRRSSTRWGTRPRTCSSTRRLLRRPGVVVLHDPSLVFFHYERSVRPGRGPRRLPARPQGHAPRPRRRTGGRSWRTGPSRPGRWPGGWSTPGWT